MQKQLLGNIIESKYINKFVILTDCTISGDTPFDSEDDAKRYQFKNYIDGFIYFIRGMCTFRSICINLAYFFNFLYK
mgnify:CR=1 FL=1